MENTTVAKTRNKKKTKKIITAMLNTIEIVIILFAFFIIIASLSNKGGGVNQLPFLKVSFLSIQTDSMEPTIMIGDLSVMKEYSNELELKAGRKNDPIPGDIIAIWVGNGESRYLRIHRLIETWEDHYLMNAEGDPLVWCKTQGDNADGPDDAFLSTDIITVYTGRIPIVGKTLDFIQQPTTFLLLVFLPMLGLFIWNLLAFIKFFVDLKRKTELAKATESGELSDELKEIAIQEFLKKQKDEKEAKEK